MNDPVPASSAFKFNQPTIVALMYLLSLFTGFPMLIALVLAYVWKDEPGAGWENSHFRFHIRSFWIGIALALIAVVPTVLTLGVAGFILYPLLMAWLAIRSIKALLAAQRGDPVHNVETWLW